MTHTEAECVEAEQWLGPDADDPEREFNGELAEEVHECPECGRTYSYVFMMHGLWSEESEEYVWER